MRLAALGLAALALAACPRKPPDPAPVEPTEPIAQRVWGLDARPAAVLPACGILQVSEGARYLQREELAQWVRGRIKVVCESYLPTPSAEPDENTLADPLCFLERADPPTRPLPAVFAVCGDADPIREDTDRLSTALTRFDGDGEVRFYPGGHAFHAFVWRPDARSAWDDTEAFLQRHVSGLRPAQAGSTLAP